jgi:hypothetical protein
MINAVGIHLVNKTLNRLIPARGHMAMTINNQHVALLAVLRTISIDSAEIYQKSPNPPTIPILAVQFL